MIFGIFPDPRDSSCLAGQSLTPASGKLERDPIHASRRALLFGLGGLALGSLSGSLFLRSGHEPSTSRSARGASRDGEGLPPGPVSNLDDDPLAPSSVSREEMPSWAVDMLSLDAVTLIRMAGEFERRSARHREDHAAALGFERLLSVALSSRAQEADMAAACALRSIKRLGRSDLVAIWADDVRLRSDFAEANRELADILDRALRQRRRMIPR